MAAGEEESPGSLSVMDGLVQTSFAVIALLNQVATRHDLSLTQLRLLAILRDREPKMAELAAHLGLEKSTVSGLIDRAVLRGLVRRVSSSDDARAVRVAMSADGRRLALLITEEMSVLMVSMTGALTSAEQSRLGSLLERLLHSQVLR